MPARVGSNGLSFGVIPRGRLFESPQLIEVTFLTKSMLFASFDRVSVRNKVVMQRCMLVLTPPSLSN
jgi:hypothetical protein